MRDFFHRPQPTVGTRAAMRAGSAAAVAIALLALTTELSGVPWLMAPFGASCVLLFSAPSSPLSQPANVIGGNVLAALIALTVVHTLPAGAWALALALGLSIAAMAWLRLTHPPAGAVAVVVMLARPGWDFLLFPALLGSVGLVIAACIAHRVPGGTNRYPLPRPMKESPAAEAASSSVLREPA
jgi:CBS-domain-containing membrane protein